jgi:hypothetical protein
VNPQKGEREETSVGSEVVAGLIGAGVALACILPPLLHLVTGPLGPFIGGFVAANRGQPGARGRAIIALVVGSATAGILGSAGAALFLLGSPSDFPDWLPSPPVLGAILAGVWLYGIALAAAGTAASAAFARKRSSSSD